MLSDRGKRVLPGGVSSNFRLGGSPVPLSFANGEGSRIRDVDGNQYVDYALGMGPAILGHAPRCVIDAVRSSLGEGQLYAGQHRREVELAEALVEIVPCAERVRFGTSGTEMIQLAIRLARAATGRPTIVKFEGHYHGWMDGVLVSVAPPPESAGPRDAPIPHLGSAGQPASVLDNLAVLGWNDLSAVARYLERHGHRTAAILMEPILCNTSVILPAPGYLEGVRALCDRYGVILIFDEVITGFRVGLGGAQERLAVLPDLAVFAKALGAGFPIAATAGRAAILDLVLAGVVHGGTYNAGVPSITAALRTIEELRSDGGACYTDMERLGEELMQGIRSAAQRLGIVMTVQGLGTVFNTAFGSGPVVDYRSYSRCDAGRQRQFLLGLQDRGVRVTGRGTWFLSTAHSATDVAETLVAVEDALRAIAAA